MPMIMDAQPYKKLRRRRACPDDGAEQSVYFTEDRLRWGGADSSQPPLAGANFHQNT
ncbi:hypothetical protein [Chitinimonas lacunae]|uniref:Uncharacterized protein n=1 Tax=Chitinimonas lacunae TaxID=1963018 RepID=A0ABV8MS87_9NEIS